MIAARSLTKRYGATTAVDGLTFDVAPGTVTGFLGPNGAGKTTTMRLILGLDAPTAGTVTVAGRHYRQMRRPLHEVGAMLESAGAHPSRTARAHLRALAAANAIPRRRVDEVLGLAGLDSVAGRRTAGFSLGMRQRLGIAAALLGDPAVLLLDEPVNGLDPEGVAWVRNLLRSLAAQGRTVFVSSHLMSEMALTADHLVVIGRGRLIADTGLDEFLRASQQGWVQVRSPAREHLARLLREQGATTGPQDDGSLAVHGTTAAAVGDLAARHGITLHELLTRHASLEQAFMEQTHDAAEYRPHPATTPETSHT
ncbi:MAG TPA: ATP-binding cassette domain-containing protein [Streptosporangiaceae bacterium]|nr:ATP-binding cassette domain-containing protein [Streptosporangiaceae bacterium]